MNGLGVARSLTRHQIPVTVLGEHPLHPALFSRGVQAVRRPFLRGESLIDALLAIAGRFSTPPFLILTTDYAAQEVSTQRHRLDGAYRFRLSDHEMTMALQTKHGVQHWAEASGLSIPRGLHITSLEQLDNLESMVYPCILKPSCRDDGYDHRFSKAYLVPNARKMRQLCQKIIPLFPNMMAQEWIPGADDAIYFCFQYRVNGAALCSFVGRKLRSWPPGVGVTSCCVPEMDHAQHLIELTDRFFGFTKVEGFASLEFKHNPRNGLFQIVEPTVGRTNAQEEIATLNGVNLPWLAYCHETGLPPPPPNPCPSPQLWHDGVSDWRSANAAGIAHDKRFPPAIPVVEAYWRADDPLPFIVHFGRRLYTAIWRRLSGATV